MSSRVNITSHSQLAVLSILPIESTVKWLKSVQYTTGPVRGFIPKLGGWFGRQGVYPEITGYFLSTFSRLYFQTGEKDYLERAVFAAEGLRRFMAASGGVSSLVSPSGDSKNIVYLFDQSIIARGLWDLYGACQKQGHSFTDSALNLASRSTDFILSQNVKGRLPDQVTTTGETVDSFSYCIMAKAALPLVSAFRFSGDQKFIHAAREILKFVINEFQSDDGRFLIEPGHIRNRTHYHCYAVEGLLSFAEQTSEPEFWAAAKAGGDFLASYLKPNGGFKNYLPDTMDDGLEDVPPVSQAVVIWAKLYTKFGDEKYLEAIDHALKYLEQVKIKSISKYLNGGFPFLLPHGRMKTACSWSSEFYLDMATHEIEIGKGGN